MRAYPCCDKGNQRIDIGICDDGSLAVSAGIGASRVYYIAFCPWCGNQIKPTEFALAIAADKKLVKPCKKN